MYIGIDGNEANQKNRVGIGQFSFNVISQLEILGENHEFIVYLKEKPVSDFPKERIGWKYEVFGPSKLWTQFSLPIRLFTQKAKLDVFFSPSHYAPRFSPVPTVISIMDLWHHRHPEQFNQKDLFQLTSWEKYSVKNSSAIITISEFSKKEILNFYKINEDKISVAYPGFNRFDIRLSNSQIDEIKTKYKINGKYFIYIGTLQPKKNIEGLIKAFKTVSDKDPDLHLVIVGKKGWLYEHIFNLIDELKIKDKVIFTGFVSEEEKPILLAGSLAFVFPSFYEGFGIPVLESMYIGVPVVTSNEGSLPEVGGEAAVYCDPYKINTITDGMEKILNLNKSARNEIIALGKVQAAKFSWEKCGASVIRALEGVINVKKDNKKN